jgi:hypothetical protein
MKDEEDGADYNTLKFSERPEQRDLKTLQAQRL